MNEGFILVSPQMKKDGEWLHIISNQLPDDKRYRYTALRNINKNEWKRTSAKRITSLAIQIPSQYIKNDSIQIGDLILTEMDKDDFRVYQIKKFKKKIEKTIEMANKMLDAYDEQSKCTVVVPADIYNEIIKYFNGKIPIKKMRIIK